MKSQRTPLQKQRYLVAGILTFIIFAFGFTLGLVFEDKRVDYVNALYEDNTLDFASSIVQYEYLTRLVSEKNCEEVFDQYHNSLTDLDLATKRLETYSNNEKINQDEFDRLKRNHVLSQLRYWMLADDIQKTCPQLEIATVLYFYGTEESCPDCEKQSFVLDYVKRLFKQNVLIFAFNAEETHEKTIDLLLSSYNMTTLPGIIVNDKIYNGFTDSDIVISDVCTRFNNTNFSICD